MNLRDKALAATQTIGLAGVLACVALYADSLSTQIKYSNIEILDNYNYIRKELIESSVMFASTFIYIIGSALRRE